MRVRRRLGYAIAFAALDLFPISVYGKSAQERLSSLAHSLRASTSALLNVLTVMILILTVAVVSSLHVGATRWLRQFVEESNYARTIEISAVLGDRARVLLDEDLERIRELSLSDGSRPIGGAFGWSDVTHWFYKSDGSQDSELSYGATVDTADSLLAEGFSIVGDVPSGAERREAQIGQSVFAGDGVGQVAVTSALLRALGYDPNEPPQGLGVEYVGRRADLQVVAVATNLARGDFLVTEQFNRAIGDRQWNPNPLYPHVHVGPFPEELASGTLEALEADVTEALVRLHRPIRAEVVLRAGTDRWLELADTRAADALGFTAQQWSDLALSSALGKVLAVAPSAAAEFPDAIKSRFASRMPLKPGFTRASVRVDRLQDVPAVADELEILGYKVLNDARGLAEMFLQVSTFGKSVMIATILVVGALAMISLGLSFTQAIQKKVREIGILKAYGAKDRVVLFVYLFQALLIWGLALLAASFLIGRLAEFVDGRLANILALRGGFGGTTELSLVTIEPLVMSAVAVGSLGLCFAATFLAGSVAVRVQPAEALRGQT